MFSERDFSIFSKVFSSEGRLSAEKTLLKAKIPVPKIIVIIRKAANFFVLKTSFQKIWGCLIKVPR